MIAHRMIGARILGTGSVLPGRLVPTGEIAALAFPGRSEADLIDKSGIHTRYWHDPALHSVASVAAETVGLALHAANMGAHELRRLILTCSHGFDAVMPATANHVAARLGLRGECDCFDLNNTCMGFLTGLDLASRCVATGLGPVAVVATELCSRVCGPDEPRPYAIMGDASGAVIVGASETGGILASHLGNDGVLSDSVTLSHGNALAKFGPTHKIGGEVVDSVVGSAQRVMKQANVQMSDIDWFLFHQPNGRLWATLNEALSVPESKRISVVHEVGSVGSASIPLCLDRLTRSGQIRPGQTLLMAAVGSGLAYGAMVFRT